MDDRGMNNSDDDNTDDDTNDNMDSNNSHRHMDASNNSHNNNYNTDDNNGIHMDNTLSTNTDLLYEMKYPRLDHTYRKDDENNSDHHHIHRYPPLNSRLQNSHSNIPLMEQPKQLPAHRCHRHIANYTQRAMRMKS